MSGLEVAGLVLAVIPLFISAFEHHEESLRPFRMFFKREKEARRYSASLPTEYASYSQTLQCLLVDFMDEDDLDAMIEGGYSELWKDPELTKKLEQQLGTAFESFCIVLGRMYSAMERLATVLDIQRQGRVTGSQLEALVTSYKPKQALSRTHQSFMNCYDFKKRLKFSYRGGQIQPLLEELERHNHILDGFAKKSKTLTKGRSKSSRRAFNIPLHHVQKGAKRLHRALSGIWTCPQHASHVVNLMLEPRVRIPDSTSKENDSLGSVTFCLTVPSFLSPSVFHSFQVHVLDDTGTAAQVQSKVSFATNSPATNQIDVTNLPKVDCLCTTMERSQSQNCIGFCLDH